MVLLKYGIQPIVIGFFSTILVFLGFIFSLNPIVPLLIFLLFIYFFAKNRFFESFLIFCILSMSIGEDGSQVASGAEDIFSMRIGGVSLFYLTILLLTPISIVYFKRVSYLGLQFLCFYICIFMYCLALTIFTDIVPEVFLFKFKYYINIIVFLTFMLFVTKESSQFVIVSAFFSLAAMGGLSYITNTGYYYGGEFFYSVPSSVLLFVILPFCNFLSLWDKLVIFSVLVLGVAFSIIPFTGKAIIFAFVGLAMLFYKKHKLLSCVIYALIFLIIPLYVDLFVSLLGTWGLHNSAYKLKYIFNVISDPSFIYSSLSTSVGATLYEIISVAQWVIKPYNFFGEGFNGYLTDPNLALIGEDGFNAFSLRNMIFYSLHMPWLNLVLAVGIFFIPIFFMIARVIESPFLLFCYFFIFAVTPQLSLMLLLIVVSDNVKERYANLRF